ncbi:MAG: DMT family transporter [Paracoccaceae bacterium]|jgi:drug/metabolite transporter (DMT)-like permease|nr:DMT family transporter [Paracoccaceae bacterium]
MAGRAAPAAAPAERRSDTMAGIALMVAAMALFASADLGIKLAAGRMAQPQVIFVLGASGLASFCALALLRGERLLTPLALHPAVLGRNAAEIVGTTSMIFALSAAPLTLVGAILQAAPLAVMAGGALFLGERVGWRRWTAAGVGFAGVLVILRPWQNGVAPGALFAVSGMLALSARDLLNRQAPAALPTSVLAAHGLFAILFLGAGWSLATEGRLLPPDPPWALIALIAIAGTGGYFTITAAVRAAPVSAVAPFRYARLLFLGALGILLLGEAVDAALVIGAALIIGSGLYALARERRALHSTPPPA